VPDTLHIDIAGTTFVARLEHERAPRTCAAFVSALPFRDHVIHVRWSGEAIWVPLGERDWSIGAENATSYPAPGQVLLYPGGPSESEILIAYGPTCFASKAGQLAGNHFLTIADNLDALAHLGPRVLREGQKEVVFSARD
jgi:hypothetical protein